jgi:hypothetical protein
MPENNMLSPRDEDEKIPARTKPSGAVSLGGGAQTPKEKGALLLGSSALVGHNAGMPPAYDFKLALTRVIEPTAAPGVELATLADAICRAATALVSGATALGFRSRPVAEGC